MGMETPEEDLDALRALAYTTGVYSSALQPLQLLEIGSWAGRTAMALASGTSHRVVHCIDHWGGNPHDGMALQPARSPREAFQTFCRNIPAEWLMTRVVPHVGHSLTYAAIWPFPLALVFIDGDHRYEQVKADILAWRPHVAPGGILCGHDYGVDGLPGVKQAVDECLSAVQHTGRFVWWVRC